MIGNGDIKMRSRWVFAGLGAGLLLTVCVLLNTGVLGEIHRARSNLKVKVTPRVFPPAPSPTADILIEDGEEASGHSFETWVYSIIAAILIGLSGIFPLLVIPLESGKALREGGEFIDNTRNIILIYISLITVYRLLSCCCIFL